MFAPPPPVAAENRLLVKHAVLPRVRGGDFRGRHRDIAVSGENSITRREVCVVITQSDPARPQDRGGRRRRAAIDGTAEIVFYPPGGRFVAWRTGRGRTSRPKLPASTRVRVGGRSSAGVRPRKRSSFRSREVVGSKTKERPDVRAPSVLRVRFFEETRRTGRIEIQRPGVE